MSDKEFDVLFGRYVQARLHHHAALKEVWEWDERLKDDTGGYRGDGDDRAAEWEAQCRREMREAFDAYIAARFGLPLARAGQAVPS